MKKCLFHKKTVIFLLPLMLLCSTLKAQYQMESLDRGVVAINQGSYNLVSWRMFGTDPSNIAFNVYRDGNKLNASPITDRTNYRDNGANAGAQYYIRPVINGVEQSPSKTVCTWGDQFLEIPLSRPSGGSNESGSYEYMPYDASVGDLDGDGQYEIIFKWDPTNAKDNSQSGHTGDVYLEAIKLDGTSMWRLNLGQNIRAGAHYTQFMVYDFDGDGKAEVMCKTAPGTRDATGAYLSRGPASNDNDNTDYANSGGYILSGPEYLTVFNGETGAEMATVNYTPGRGNVSSWGDGYGNRVDRFLAGVAYLDGQHPSAVFCRGYYTRTVIAAWDFDGTNLTQRWVFDTDNGMQHLEGKGNHQLSVADLDNDGRQEIIYGALAIDDDGGVLHSQTWLHGDALHVGEFDLDNPGLEIFMPTESGQANPASGRPAVVMRDGESGNILWATYRDGDFGRGICTNIDARYPGAECWGSGGQGLFDSKGNNIGSIPGGINFTIWWDGDLERELLDEEKLDDYNNGVQTRQYTIYNDGADAINGSKANPNLQADILGDWREELIYRKYTNDALLVFTTNFETDYRLPTLMHDPQYRMAVAWQNVGYNQPPHPSFYLGSDMPNDPVFPPIVVGENTSSQLQEGYYQISAVHSGLCIQNNNPPTQEACADAQNQYWQVIKVGEEYQIRSVESGEYMSGGSNTQGQNTGMSSSATNLTLSSAGGGNFYISPASTPNLFFDVLNISTAESEPLILWENTGNTNQHFTFTPVELPTDCNGDVYGTATLDDCGICVGGNTGATACAGVIQGENFCEADGVTESNNAGYNGTGYLNYNNATNTTATWTINSTSSQTAEIGVRYANGGGTARPLNVVVNGSSQATVSGSATGGWTTWTTENITLSLNSGINTIEMIATSTDGGPNVDQLNLITAGLSAGSCNSECLTDTDADGTPDCTDDCPNDGNKILAGECGCGVVEGTCGTGNIVVRATGVVGGEHMQVQVDGNIIAEWDMVTSYQEFIVDGPSSGTFRIYFTNDQGDFDIQVDYLEVDGVVYQAEDQSINTSYYANGSCGGGSNSEIMNCNGYIEFVINHPDDDGDGTPNTSDGCPNDANKVAPGICGCGSTDVDIDNDGVCDTEDDFIDVDEDGIAQENDCDDNNENIGEATVWYKDGDGDGVGDADVTLTQCDQPSEYVATSGDECPNDMAKTLPGECGCGVEEGTCQDCAGVVDGTATVDACGICSGGTTGVTACTNAIQAEDACSIDGTIDNNNAGFTGAGFANTTNAVDANVILAIEASASRTVTIGFVYANGGTTDRPAAVTVNGNSAETLTLASTGTWTTWETETISLSLDAGTNVIELTATTNNGIANLDQLTFTTTGYSLGTCAEDCNGDIGGVATTDACGKCIGGNTGATSDDADADGILDCEDDYPNDFDNDGVTTNDDCDDTNASVGAAQTWYADTDNDGVGEASTTQVSCTQPNGYVATSGDECPDDQNKTQPGECGCGNTEASCLDCAGTPNGDAFEDNCGNCVATAQEACTQDCYGDWGGTATLDACNECAGGNTGIPPVTDPQNCIATSIEEYNDLHKLVYPNPTIGDLHINKSASWILLDMTGMELERGNASLLSLADYAPGVYFLRIDGKIIKVIKE